jgi:FKBP-type peptidyl-prolyl cis-trans isomerase 2
MKEGSFVSINYVGRVKDSGEIFDLTDEELAKKEGIYNPKIRYGPITVVVGANFVIKGLDAALKDMKVGEKKNIEIEPENAFGERRADLIKLIPQAAFEQQNVVVEPGRYVTINGITGRVVSVDGGRVKIDFNHPLAGKKLLYEVEIKSEVKEVEEKVKSIVKFFTGIEESVSVKIFEKVAKIELQKDVNVQKNVKQKIAEEILKWVDEVKEVEFVERFTK